MTTHQKLKAEFPTIAITTEWKYNSDYEWDDDGQWVQLEWAQWVGNASALISTINTLKP